MGVFRSHIFLLPTSSKGVLPWACDGGDCSTKWKPTEMCMMVEAGPGAWAKAPSLCCCPQTSLFVVSCKGYLRLYTSTTGQVYLFGAYGVSLIRGQDLRFISAADFECIGLTFWSEFRSSKSQCQKSSCIHSQILPCIWSETSTKAKAAANNKFNNVRTGGPWSGGKLWHEKQAWPQWTGSQSGDSNTWNPLCPTATDSYFHVTWDRESYKATTFTSPTLSSC